MKIVRQLKRAFLLVAGTLMLSSAAAPRNISRFENARNDFNQTSQIAYALTTSPITLGYSQTNAQTVKLDFAFGDQVAMHSGLPGAGGENWGPQMIFRGLRDFNDAHPGLLQGKNIMLNICDGTMVGTFLYVPKITSLINEIKPAHVIVLGVSETRTDLDGADTNRQLKEYVESKGAIYGGALPSASSDQNIYPVTAAEFAAAKQQAETVLRTHVQKTQGVAPTPQNPKPSR